MITARTAKGTQVHVHMIEDCDINKGGYFCQVYTAECDEDNIDYFVIHVEDIINTKDPYHEAEKLAIKYIKSITEY